MATDFEAIADATTDTTGSIPDHTKSAPTAKARFETCRESTKLGANKATRSAVRKLTDDDKKKIEGVYAAIALVFVAPTPLFNQDAAEAFAGSAEQCAQAWFTLAENNDSVRRVLLMFIEGGAWGALAAAHVPILMAFMPEQTKRMMAGMFMRAEVPDSPEGL